MHSATAIEGVAEAGANKDSHVFRKDGGGQEYCWWRKSCTTWDVQSLANNGKNYLSTGAGFPPSTVWVQTLVSFLRAFPILRVMFLIPDPKASQTSRSGCEFPWRFGALVQW